MIAHVAAQAIRPERHADIGYIGIAICVGLIEPVDSLLLVTAVQIPKSDACGIVIFEFLIPARQDVGDGPLRALVFAFREARANTRRRSRG